MSIYSNSVRTSKTVNGVEYTYAYLNGKLMYETRGNAKFYYSYDANGTLYSVNYTLTDSSTMQTYYYTHNAQDDIIGIYDSTGTLVTKYTYGDWGNVVSITDANGTAITDANHIATLNPFRYRSYVYDEETDLYYLQSRYYDPFIGRFLNADVYCDTQSTSPLSTNMFAYCENNSVNNIDPDGFKAKNLEQYIKSIKGTSVFGDKKIKLEIKNNKITITVGFTLDGKLRSKKINNKFYNQLFFSGIEKYWKGNFKIYGYNVSLKTIAIQRYTNEIRVNSVDKFGISNVSLPFLGWSISNYGKMTIYKGDSRNNVLYSANQFERVAAHEFGHILGVSDLYKKSQKVIRKYSYPGNYSFMAHQWAAPHINNYDLYRVLLAFMYNKYQGWN